MDNQKPNIILITADEQRKDSLSCYGNNVIKTPNIDNIGDKGIRFDKAYTVSPWCLPARCSILTGLFPHNSGAYSNFRKCELNTGIPNLFKELKKNGYTTSLTGKCHFAPVPYSMTTPDKTLPYDDFRNYYLSLGLDHLDLQDDKQVSAWFYDDYSKELDKEGYLEAYRHCIWDKSKAKVFPFPGPPEWHPDAWVGRKATEYIENYSGSQPMFTWVSFSGPHYPFDAPSKYLDMVDIRKDPGINIYEKDLNSPERIHYESYHGGGRIDGCGMAKDRACKNYSEDYWKELRRSYFANILLIDEQVGKILEAAKKNFGDNVLVIYTADHGEMLGNHGIWGKHNCGYEDVWNIPMLVKYPNTNDELISDDMVMLTDILPTCLKAAGANMIPCDGIDYKENMKNGGYKYVFAEGEGYVSVSDSKYKYIHIQKNNKKYRELLNLNTDPNETINLINENEYSRKLSELREKIVELFMKNLLP